MFRYIYRYRNKLNGKVYIGQTIDIERRKSEHLKDAERGTGFVFHRALRKYGIDCFDFDVLHVIEGDALEYLEDRTLASDKITLYKSIDILYYYNINM